MPRETFDMNCLTLDCVMRFARDRVARFPHYRPALDLVTESYHDAHRRCLRFNRRTWTTRDNRLGWLSRPSNIADITHEATPDEALYELCREIWCNAVRRQNINERTT